ncbi:MAG TPA: bifunctional phosphoribosyl-AMP cyclohydrolase/phosphoribosyl-ATP diphosphatase HisIE [Verrucomicrobiae bacterium]|nr:bifunctional phosphoribosyl-AMP cyclohydrolase/phosphoribosyl-ATP diphosphatase HisIE [Verrucomicrobiae bacterium]
MLIVSDSRIIDSLKFNEQGLLPAIVQDAKNGQVLMLAYMNRESLGRTLAEGKACYYSRSRQSLWLKGETSGNFQYVQRIYFDCDADTLLIMVEQDGVACHEGYYTCFHNEVNPDGSNSVVGKPGVIPGNDLGKVLNELYTLIMDRKTSRPEGAYTTYLFDKGQDKILKKVGEEAAETLIASKNHNRDELVYEVSDLFYHLMVLLAYHEMEPGEIATELIRRRKK